MAMKYLNDEKYREAVIELSFQVAVKTEKPLADEIGELWRESALDSTEFSLVNSRYLSIKLPALENLKRVRKSRLKKLPKDRPDELAAVIKFQLELEGESAEEIFAAARAHFGMDDKSREKFHEDAGGDVGDDFWKYEGEVQQDGRNRWISAGAKMVLKEIPSDWAEGSFVIKARMLLGEGEGQYVSLTAGNRTHTVTHEGGNWVYKSGTGSESQRKAKPGKWQEVKFVITDNSNTNEKKMRDISVFVGGNQMYDGSEEGNEGSADGDFKGVTMGGGEGELCFGGGSAK